MTGRGSAVCRRAIEIASLVENDPASRRSAVGNALESIEHFLLPLGRRRSKKTTQ
jgi:hypothetical protein